MRWVKIWECRAFRRGGPEIFGSECGRGPRRACAPHRFQQGLPRLLEGRVGCGKLPDRVPIGTSGCLLRVGETAIELIDVNVVGKDSDAQSRAIRGVARLQ